MAGEQARAGRRLAFEAQKIGQTQVALILLHQSLFQIQRCNPTHPSTPHHHTSSHELCASVCVKGERGTSEYVVSCNGLRAEWREWRAAQRWRRAIWRRRRVRSGPAPSTAHSTYSDCKHGTNRSHSPYAITHTQPKSAPQCCAVAEVGWGRRRWRRRRRRGKAPEDLREFVVISGHQLRGRRHRAQTHVLVNILDRAVTNKDRAHATNQPHQPLPNPSITGGRSTYASCHSSKSLATRNCSKRVSKYRR